MKTEIMTIKPSGLLKCFKLKFILRFSFFLLSVSLVIGCLDSSKNNDPEEVINEVPPPAGTNNSPSLSTTPASGDQIIASGNAIASIDPDDSGDDFDIDQDPLLYSCEFSGGGFAAGTACSSLPGVASLNTGTGVFNWTPSHAAVVGGISTSYSISLIASDQQTPPLTGSVQFTISVNPSVQLTNIADRSHANGSAVTQATAMSPVIDINNVVTGDDSGMSYTCLFDTTIDNSVTSSSDCTAIQGTTTFNTSTGILTWTPLSTETGHYEIKVTGTNSSSTNSQIFVLFAQEDYSRTNLLVDFVGFLANYQEQGTTESVWRDLAGAPSTNNDGQLLMAGGGSTPGWVGTGALGDAYSVQFDATVNRVDVGSHVNADLASSNKLMFSTWVRPSQIGSGTGVILGNGGVSGDGFSIRETINGSVQFLVGNLSTSAYDQLVLTDGASAYWRLGENSGPTAQDSAGSSDGVINGSAISYKAPAPLLFNDDGAMGYSGSGDFIALGNPTVLQNTGDQSIEMWLKPNSFSSRQNPYAKAYGGEGTITQETNGRLTYFYGTNGGNGSPYTACATTTPLTLGQWNHVALVRDFSTTNTVKWFINGVLNRTCTALYGAVVAGTNPAYIGRGYVNDYNGSIDEVAIYNSALTPTQIQNHYLAASTGGCNSTSKMTNNSWSHIAGTYDGTTAALYVNGVQSCSSSNIGVMSPASQNLVIGANADASQPWKGRVSDFKIYSEGVSGDITDLYNRSIDNYRPSLGNIILSDAILILDPSSASQGMSFPGAGCSLNSWFDRSSQGQHGVLSGFSSCGANSGWLGQGDAVNPHRLEFDGTNDAVNLSLPNITTTAGDSVTVELWMYWDGAMRAMPFGFTSYDIYINGGNIGFNTAAGDIWGIDSAGLSGRWVHLVAVFNNGDATTNKLYIDGQAQALSQKSGSTGSRTVSTTAKVSGWINGSGYNFGGSIGWVGVYNKELNSSEVLQNCNANKARFQGASCF